MSRFLSLPTLLFLALIIRLIWAFLIPFEPISDAAAYQVFARNIADHGVFGFTPDQPGAYWAVGTPALYAGGYLLIGDWGSATILINLISSLIVVWGLWHLGRHWFDDRVGAIAALFFVVWPVAIQFTTTMASELHFMSMTLLGLVAWVRARHITSGGFWVLILLSGLAFAGATYLRPIALLVPAALFAAAVLRHFRSAFTPGLKAALVTVLVFACVAPWSARNERVFGEPVFMSTNFWANFWMGNHPGTNGEYAPLPPETDGLGEIERNAFMKELALEYLKAEPAEFVLRSVRKSVRLHSRETIGVVWNEKGIHALVGDLGVTGLKLLSTLWWYAMLFLAFAGILFLLRRHGIWAGFLSPPVWLWLYFTGIHAVIVVGDRYHMPAIPMIALLAAVGASGFISMRRQ